jgi:K+-transporting ATPase ATPase B chain
MGKFFIIVPAIFSIYYENLAELNFLHLHSPASAILSAVIFNALIILLFLPLALAGVNYRPSAPYVAVKKFTLQYGMMGLIIPFIGIKIIDMVLSFII